LIGVWDRGGFEITTAGVRLRESSVLLLAGTAEQLSRFDDRYAVDSPAAPKAVIIGGGRVGRAIGQAFSDEGVDFAIVEQLPERERKGVSYVIGDAADRDVLTRAGIDDADAVLITTHDDNVNVYLTRYCRGLRPDVRIVSRSRLDRNVSTLYRAGADSVLSYAATGSTAIWNHLRRDETLLIAHGLNVFRSPIPQELAGRTLAEAHVYRRTSCNVIAIETADGIHANPDAQAPLPSDGELLLVATDAAKARFSEVFPHARKRVLRPRLRR
jgi:Trk K+ transport system NAD-binding subunit